MKKILFTIATLFAFIFMQAQYVVDYLKAADEYYKKADYYSAAQYYEKYLTQGSGKAKKEGYNPYVIQAVNSNTKKTVSTKEQAVYNAAESYRKLHYYEKAEPYYRQAANFDKVQFPLAAFWYAETARALKKYDEAEKAYNVFLDDYKEEDQYSEAAKREIQNLRFAQSEMQKSTKRFTVSKASRGLNDTGASYAPVWVDANRLMFTSTRPDASIKGQQFVNREYEAEVIDGNANNFSKLLLPEQKDMQQGSVSLNADKTIMYLTRWKIDAAGKKISAIYVSKKAGNGWSEPVLMDATVNAAGFNSQQPFIMPDGNHLIFSSDRSGGKGGFDLWAATLDENGKAVNIENLGSNINTINDDVAPFFHQSSGTLVFSSNGRVGMGGFDFYSSKLSNGNWSEPQNLGYPVNSIKDDIYFTSRGPARNMLEDVVLSSDREASCCLELYFLKKEKPLKQISGVVTSCNGSTPISGAVVNVVDPNNKTIISKTTGVDGSYFFELEEYQPLQVTASSTGYKAGSLRFSSPNDLEDDKLANPALCLQPDVPEITVLSNVLYDYNKSTLRTQSFASLDSVVNMLNANPQMVIEIRAHTDNIGNDAYNQKLSDARANSVVTYLISKGIAADRLQAKGFGSSIPIAPNTTEDGKDNPEGRQLNRRTEFSIIKK